MALPYGGVKDLADKPGGCYYCESCGAVFFNKNKGSGSPVAAPVCVKSCQCDKEACDNGQAEGELLSFTSATVLHSNLGGKGPGGAPEELIIDGVGVSKQLALKVKALSEYTACSGQQG